jgi:hypothetical protein
MLSELSQLQRERHISYDFTFYEVLREDKVIETEIE